MSKSGKSVSDIMQHRVVFPNGREQSFSAQFEVRNHPVVMKAYNMGCDTVGHIEMGHMDGCGGTNWAPFSPLCDQVLILACTNIVSIMVPGLYRVVFRNRITGELETGLDDLLVTVTETDMPASMLANFGGSTMACGNRVSIHQQENGCVIINVDDVPTTICPGSQVSCAPQGAGILIDGELCAFPDVPDVSVRIDDNGCLLIGIDNEVVSFCPTENTDSVTIASMDMTTGVVTIVNPDGSSIMFDGQNTDTNSVTLASIDADELVTITNPDGSTVQFDGGNDVTIADIDAAARVITITNPDGSVIQFPYADDEEGVDVSVAQPQPGTTIITVNGVPYTVHQTQVTRGTGSRPNMQTLTADHKTTYPNVMWREAWMERSGDIVTIHGWNPVDNEWDAVTIEAPENLVILNNPVIYIRKDTGQPNPPIVTQADLTVANAFDSVSAVRAFMQRTLLVGTVTLDMRGDFSSGPTIVSLGAIGPGNFKNAQNILIRGDGSDVSALKIPWAGPAHASHHGLTVTGGTVRVRDLTFVSLDQATNAVSSVAAPLITNGPANIQVEGTIKFEGIYDSARPNSSAAFLGYCGSNGEILLSRNVVAIFAMTGSISNLMSSVSNGGLFINGNVVFNIEQPLTFLNSVFHVVSNVYFAPTVSADAPTPLAITGAARFVAPYSVRVAPLGVVASNGYGNRAAFLGYDFGADVSLGGAQATFLIDPIGVVMGVAGP